MPIGRRPAKEPAAPRLNACEDEAPDELVWKAPDEELDHVLVSVDCEKEVDGAAPLSLTVAELLPYGRDDDTPEGASQQRR